MDMHGTVEKDRRDKLILLETGHSLNQLSKSIKHIVTEGCGQIDTTMINYHLIGVTGIVEFRKGTTDDL